MSEQQSVTTGVVFYTDGGARPNPGYTGWGAHGYKYTTEPSTQGSGLSKYRITPLGYCAGESDAPVVQPLCYYDFYGANPPEPTTNNAAELDALLNVLQFIAANLPEITQLHILTDSEYVRRGVLQGLPIWEKRHWLLPDGRPVANQDRWKAVALLLAEAAARGVAFSIAWIESHNNHVGNTLADLLATVGVQAATAHRPHASLKATPAKGYWKAEQTRHPFLGYRRLYFNSGAEYNQPGSYFLSDPHGKEDTVGKKQPNTAYAMVRLTPPDPAIELVKATQCAIPDSVNAVMELHLDVLRQPRVAAFLNDYGANAILRTSSRRLGLSFLDNQPLTVEKSPVGLLLRAIECSAILEERLLIYIADRDQTPCPVDAWANRQYHDITDTFYAIKPGKKKEEPSTERVLRPEFGVGTKEVSVTLEVTLGETATFFSIVLVLGSDLPDRNDLKRMESLAPRLYVMTWQESQQTVHYSVLIEVTGAIGIWSNFYANQVFFPIPTS